MGFCPNRVDFFEGSSNRLSGLERDLNTTKCTSTKKIDKYQVHEEQVVFKDPTCLNEEKSKIASTSQSLLYDIQSTEVFDAEGNSLGNVGALTMTMDKVRHKVCLMERKVEEAKLPTPSLGGNLPVGRRQDESKNC